MKISIEFTQEELQLIARALTFGIIHTNEEKEEIKFKELERKISMIGALGGG